MPRSPNERTRSSVIYLMRHAEKEPSLYRWDGKDNYLSLTMNRDISTKGKRNMRTLAKDYIFKLDIDKIISSQYKRAITTAELISKEINIKSEVLIDSRINERLLCVGINNQEEIMRVHQASMLDWNWGHPTGETMNDVRERAMQCINEISLRDISKNYLFVTHLRVIQACAGNEKQALFSDEKIFYGKVYEVTKGSIAPILF